MKKTPGGRWLVARSTRAWIETTKSVSTRSAGNSSHALRVRGLKRFEIDDHDPFDMSHALRVRGLKQRVFVVVPGFLESHALRVRGLKQKPFLNPQYLDGVARSTRAWIETTTREPPTASS